MPVEESRLKNYRETNRTGDLCLLTVKLKTKQVEVQENPTCILFRPVMSEINSNRPLHHAWRASTGRCTERRSGLPDRRRAGIAGGSASNAGSAGVSLHHPIGQGAVDVPEVGVIEYVVNFP